MEGVGNHGNGMAQVVLVTGGAGFLGQHLVKLLQEYDDSVSEIRVFDIKPHVNTLGYKEYKPVKSMVGDLRSKSDLQAALKGVDVVFHIAGLISFGTFPDYESMEQINVRGTEKLIAACVAENVSRLIYTSSVDVVIGHEEIINGDEELATPARFLFPGYPDTKARAEGLVLAADGRPLAEGGQSRLRTLSLRPNVMYGEGDPYYVVSALRTARDNGGVLPVVGDCSALFQQAYVGNVAWAHVLANRALEREARVGGEAYFVTDDTPLENSFLFLRPFLHARRCCLSAYRLPYPLVYGGLRVAEFLLWLLSPVWRLSLPTTACSVAYICHTYTFSRRKAERLLAYRPLYDPDTALHNSMLYYSQVDLHRNT